MADYDVEEAGFSDEKFDDDFRDDIQPATCQSPISDWSDAAESTSLMWKFRKTTIRLPEKASPRQNATILKYVLIAIVAAFLFLNFTSVLHGMHTRRTARVVSHVAQQTGYDIPAKGLVMASFEEQNVTWAEELPEDWQIYRYILDDQSPEDKKPPPDRHLTIADRLYDYTYTVSRNNGREAMAYLTFIIDHYDRLPLFTAFTHGHERAWHQVEPMQWRLQSVNLSVVANDGYTSFRCYDRTCRPEEVLDLTQSPEAEKRPAYRVLPEFWRLVFPDIPPPTRFQHTMNAQFIVTRATLRSRPLEFYKSLRRPLERDPQDYFEALPHLEHANVARKYTWILGLMYEYLWPVIFQKPAIWCPSPEWCRHTAFSGVISCNQYLDNLPQDPFLNKTICTKDDDRMAQAMLAQDDVVRNAWIDFRREMSNG